MKHIQNTRTDPFFNLALEEYLLRHTSFESFMLWRSEPCIVVGKHQNALSEVNFPYVYENDVVVARRLSGGGTVFHGPGNLNFTFIRNGEPGRLIDFKKHTAPIIDFLNDMGVQATFEGKNDLRVHGLKISGNAEHVYKNRVLHHGTLLYDADLSMLNEAIMVKAGRYQDKSVQSVRSRVANVSGFLTDPPGFNQFREMLAGWLTSYFKENIDGRHEIVEAYRLNPEEISLIEKLASEKYAQWDWNYGYSPDYRFSGSSMIEGEPIGLELFVSKGGIRKASLTGPVADNRWQQFAGDLSGCRHHVADIFHLLQVHELAGLNRKRMSGELLNLFF